MTVASIGFDAMGWDLYGALLNGATLVIAHESLRNSILELHQFMDNQQVTMATLTFAVAELMPTYIP